jgi:hypothetical protein
MDVPEDIERYPRRYGARTLAARLGLPYGPDMQDWEYEIADPAYFQEWLVVYREAALSDDERYSLMEMLVQCVEDLARQCATPEQVEQLPEWRAIDNLLRARMALHAHTVAYWAAFDSEDLEQAWAVAGPMRRIWAEWEPKLTRDVPGRTGDRGLIP